MFTNGGFHSQIGYNGIKSEPRLHPIDNKRSHTNHESKTHQSTSVKPSFIKRFNPFSKSKSQTINCGIDCDCVRHESLNDKEEFASVKVLKQFWNDQIKTAKSIEHLNRNQKSATIKYFSKSNDSLNDFQPNRAEKALTLDGRLPVDEFNKFKDANFVRNKKSRLKYCAGNDVPVITLTSVKTTKYPRTDSFTLNDNHFPQVSATGGKIHWAKREDIFTKKTINDEMSVKSNKMNGRNSTESCETKCKSQKASHETKKESISSSAGSLNSSVTSNTTNSTTTTSRKFSFKTAPSTTATYMNKRIASTSNGTKVAQIAQRFNQMIQQDATILDEVKKRGTVVLHRSGGCVFKIKEEKVDNRSIKKLNNDDASDDCSSLPSIGKNSTRKKNSLKKRPSIRILVESPRKEGKSGNVLSKKQLYETNIVNKETIVLKPKVPDKSERVLAKTKELKIKKLKETDMTETNAPTPTRLDLDLNQEGFDENQIVEQVQSSPIKDHKKNNFQKIYDKISFRPTFLYGKKVATTTSKLETTYEVIAKPADTLSPKKLTCVDDISKETEDELEFKPIDLNLNVYFNNENLSTGPKDLCVEEDENTKSQGPFNDVTAAPSVECKPDQSAVDVKPNESFLFRTQLSGKLDTACDVFIRDMLNETSTELESNRVEPAENPKGSFVTECNIDQENNYEFISKATTGSEGTDIDKTNDGNSSSKDGSEENIYQSLCEVKGETESVKSYESFENYDEIAQNILDNKINLSELLMTNEDDYIFPEKAPEPPPPRKNTIPKISSPILTSTTSNLVQSDLQVPKLKLNYELQKSDSCVSTAYEKIKYDQLSTLRKQLQAKLPLPPRNDQQPLPCDDENIYDTIKNNDDQSLVVSSFDETSDKNKTCDNPSAESDSFDDGENPYKNSKNDTMSIISNCYESISLKQNYSTINQILRHAISTSTLTSEHRINSIYGTMVGQSLTPPSDRSASDNSDEWIDLSDEENDVDNITDNRFIVICKKTKTHKSPDWSRLVRQKLDEWDVFVTSKSYIYITSNNEVAPLPKAPQISDHNRAANELHANEPIYENIENGNIVPSDDNKFTIYVNYDFIKGGKCKSSVRLLEPDVEFTQIQTKINENVDECDEERINSNDNDDNDGQNNSKTMSKMIQCQQISMYIDDSDHHYESLYSIQQQRAALEGKLEKGKPLDQQNDFDKFRENSEDYDSFDDSDDENHFDESKTNVDLTNVKLPDPPQNTGQVYAFVQKIKNFGSISKNEISKGISKIAKKRSSLGKLPSSRSQFYENSQIVEEDSTYSPPKFESKSLGKKARGLSKLQKLGRLTINKLPTNFSLNEPYDQSEYQTPRIGEKENESISSPNLSKSMSNFNSPENEADFQSAKNKNEKSSKSKFRKGSAPSFGSSSTSNIYGSLSSKNSTFYVTDSLDVDSGIFAVNEKSTSSPDNSNLNLSSNSSSSVSCDLKRRSIASISSNRPNDPPPPPPSETRSRRIGSTSWYAECGLFKNEDIHDEEHIEDGEKTGKTTASWYTESGLYQTSNNSVASSSGSSGVSTGGECSPCGDENSHSMFLNEPLYQLYTAAKLESISSSEFEPEVESDGYEEISKKDIQEIVDKKPPRPSALQLIEPNQGPSRTLWSEVPEVIQSGIFEKLSQNEKRLQEAKFEVLTSEASYLKSLNLLRSHFMNHPAFRDPATLDPADRKTLFSYIIPVLECSDRLLSDLESSWQDNVMLVNLSKNIFKHAEKHFHVYISYCEHQGRLDRTLKRLKEFNSAFKETLDVLENDSVCCGLNLHSFLMLPMQRITRLPLLIDAVMTKLKSNDEEFDDWKMTLAILNKVVFQCNQAANRCEQAFEMEILSKQIEFPANITPFPLIPFNVTPNNRLPRTLVRRGELVHIIYRGDDAKLTFGKKATLKKNIYCFLFTDLIILTKKKSDESFLVFDYCQRSLLQVSSADVIPQLPAKDISHAGKFIMFMSLLENCIGKPIDLILSCSSETERQRWLQVTAPPTSENPYETLYEQWDCPQVVVKHSYQALEPDELTLDVGDVVNVLRKMKDDGWYFGERIRDGNQGWFPGNYAEEVHSSHVRARNLKQRHRLLLYTATYLESQKEPVSKKK